MNGKLFIVPTPVGNMSDMAPRAIETLKNADLILCEDTRTSAVLLRKFEIATPTSSHHKFNEHNTAPPIAERILAGENIALISDAGTPGISDPGFLLVRQCRSLGVTVETLPGPTALIPALINSGLPCDRFVFEGFLPVKKGRATRLAEIGAEERTVIIYESPLRLVKTLGELAKNCGDSRQASVSREISKIYDTTVSGSLQQLQEHFRANIPKGEIVIVIEGNNAKKQKAPHKNKYKENNPPKTVSGTT
ncbi:16S rRNA (cytidine(1402)-2'-O)-methyltransferase [uncultured Muribaculum sp.]|uniref:16S rRNA (cytidine(1402)-2'-O)-methyltransferase n=1 Tax=uncultured Muribaculum sp. TaxID=1918613 RepID=UPI00258F5708|nr:16S rRNA (cytidine(1402)-2'-O)-methyltransferase [uncultured Muribaculum sp.]